MKTDLRKVYSCDHCKKTMLSAGAMSRHERFCKKNPANRHKCFDLCKHLQRTNYFGTGVQFQCEITHKKMFSFLLEKKYPVYSGEYKRKTEGLIIMPLACDDYEEMTYSEQEKRFAIKDPDGL